MLPPNPRLARREIECVKQRLWTFCGESGGSRCEQLATRMVMDAEPRREKCAALKTAALHLNPKPPGNLNVPLRNRELLR